MNWKDWVIVILVAFTAGWMLFDGSRALIVSDYVTPKSGEYAGQLGLLSNLVKAVGIELRSTLMKLIFVGYSLTKLDLGLLYVWLGMGAHCDDRCMFPGLMVITDWHNYESHIPNSAFDWKKIGIPEFIRDAK